MSVPGREHRRPVRTPLGGPLQGDERAGGPLPADSEPGELSRRDTMLCGGSRPAMPADRTDRAVTVVGLVLLSQAGRCAVHRHPSQPGHHRRAGRDEPAGCAPSTSRLALLGAGLIACALHADSGEAIRTDPDTHRAHRTWDEQVTVQVQSPADRRGEPVLIGRGGICCTARPSAGSSPCSPILPRRPLSRRPAA